MILFSELRSYMESLVDSIPGLKSCVPITVETNMADKVSSIPTDETPVLFYLPPSGSGDGSPDAFTEETACVLFVMEKYNPRTTTSAEVLELTHPLVETLKGKLLEAARCPCHFMHIVVPSISTLPETEFFGNWAGWSIAFTVNN